MCQKNKNKNLSEKLHRMSQIFQKFLAIRTMTTSTAQKIDTTEIKNPLAGRKFKQSELDFMKFIERQNLERVTKLKALRKKNVWTGLAIGGTVISIYLYSMLAIKQEKFLDDFNEPQKVSNE